MASGGTIDAYEQARDEYERLLRAYSKAVEKRAPNAAHVFWQAGIAWDRVCALAPNDGSEAELDVDTHLVLGFSCAVAAGDQMEAQRLYNAMSDDWRKTTDAAEEHAPRSMKIWLIR